MAEEENQLLYIKNNPVVNLFIERAKSDYLGEITGLFYDTIQNINIRDYSIDEVNDWSSWHQDHSKWVQKIEEQYFIIARSETKIVGFGSVSTEGYLDLMFVHKDFQKKGIATALLKNLENFAINQKIRLLTADVSITASGFFLNSGFVIEARQKKKSKDLYLTSFKMSKVLY